MSLDSRQTESVFGVPIYTSPFVPEGKVITMQGATWFHSRMSARAKMRRNHGRPRNAPRRWKVRYVRYQPDLDRVLAVTTNIGGEA